MAEGLLKKMLRERLGEASKQIRVLSAGLNAFEGYVTGETFQVMREEGVDLSTFRSKQLTLEMVEKADLILTMQRSHKFHVFALDPKARDRTFTLKEFSGENEKPDIVDPYGRGMHAYKACAEEIKDSLNKAFEKILRFLGKRL
jgi:protein-tyrosine-phosphatase